MHSLKNIFYTGVALFGLSGCFLPFKSKEPTLNFHADVDFSPTERQCIQAGADVWRAQTSNLADITFDYDYEPTKWLNVLERKHSDRIVRWTSETPELKAQEAGQDLEPGESPWMILGQADGKITDAIRTPIEVRFVMDRLTDQTKCHMSAIHEFGHTLGLPHFDRKTDIMYPAIDVRRSVCLKNEELMFFALVNKLPGNLMKPCPDDPDSAFADPVKVGLSSAFEPVDSGGTDGSQSL